MGEAGRGWGSGGGGGESKYGTSEIYMENETNKNEKMKKKWKKICTPQKNPP